MGSSPAARQARWLQIPAAHVADEGSERLQRGVALESWMKRGAAIKLDQKLAQRPRPELMDFARQKADAFARKGGASRHDRRPSGEGRSDEGVSESGSTGAPAELRNA
jgi:hypothetical protein